MARRLLDVVCALVALVLVAPILVLAAGASIVLVEIGIFFGVFAVVSIRQSHRSPAEPA